jgi:Ca2+-transporting ATPase
MVLMDDNFVTIVSAVEEGRKIFDNIRRFVSYNITTNIGGIILIFGAALLDLPLPLFAVQLLWINIMMDGPPAVALGVEPTLQNVMKRRPRRADEWILSGPTVFRIVSLALLMGALNLLLYYWVFTCGSRAGDELYARTMVLTSFIMFQMFSVMNYRSEEHSAFQIGFFRNRMIILAVAVSMLLHLLVVYLPALQGFFHTTPLSRDDWLIIIPLAASVFVFEEARKATRRLFVQSRGQRVVPNTSLLGRCQYLTNPNKRL